MDTSKINIQFAVNSFSSWSLRGLILGQHDKSSPRDWDVPNDLHDMKTPTATVWSFGEVPGVPFGMQSDMNFTWRVNLSYLVSDTEHIHWVFKKTLKYQILKVNLVI